MRPPTGASKTGTNPPGRSSLFGECENPGTHVFPATLRESQALGFLFAGSTKVCEGDGCTTEIPISDVLCGHCAIRATNEEHAQSVYASDGIVALEHYLERWADFEAQYGPN